jgi:hypothetical protein
MATINQQTVTWGQYLKLMDVLDQDINYFSKVYRILTIFYPKDKLDLKSVFVIPRLLNQLATLTWPNESSSSIEINGTRYFLITDFGRMTVYRSRWYHQRDEINWNYYILPFLEDSQGNHPQEEELNAQPFEKVGLVVNAFSNFYHQVQEQLNKVNVQADEIKEMAQQVNLQK